MALPVQTRPTKASPFAPLRNFSSLSLPDLIEARDLYHRHLSQRKGVVATAVGKYLIRSGDSHPGDKVFHHGKGPKLLSSTEIRDYSWPCVLVFVEKWVDELKLPHGYTPADLVPPALYMPDGRVVPVCVVEAPAAAAPLAPAGPLRFPKRYLGGGVPLVADVQGGEHVGTAACLVTDGHATYALTSRHVAGDEGTPIHVLRGDERLQVGEASGNSIRKRPFSALYPEWPNSNLQVNLDVGLVRVDDASQWTSEVVGIGKLADMIDLGTDGLGLHLVGLKVRGFGAVSGLLEGQVAALFYRYAAAAGAEYCADFLVGPRADKPLETRRGDSGTLWCVDSEDSAGRRSGPARPFGIEWGGHVFVDSSGNARRSYALVTNLSVACRELDVELLNESAAGIPEYWGTFGHFSIASAACELVGKSIPSLRKLMTANLTNITYTRADLAKDQFGALTKAAFVPLADVSDMAWKSGPAERGPRGQNPENPNHFADMDQEPPGGGKTLLELSADPRNLDPDAWIKFLKKFPKADPTHAGLLPFRVWQIFDALVGFARAGDAKSFVCAAGVLAHYVGDATQPLHCSYLHHGDPKDDYTVTVNHTRGKQAGTTTHETRNPATNVHSEFEQDMFLGHETPLRAKVDQLVKTFKRPAAVTTGKQAAALTVALMKQSFSDVPPPKLVEFYKQLAHAKLSKKARLEKLWSRYGTAAAGCFAHAALALAVLWESAWTQGNGTKNVHALGPIPRAKLSALYDQKTFLPSYWLTEIRTHLKGV